VSSASVALALLFSAGTARAADCSPPAWLKTVDLKQTPQDAVGSGKGSTLDLARRDARRAVGLRIAKPRLADILALPAVKDTVNRKVYTKEDLLKAIGLAVALNVQAPKKLADGAVCKVFYVALSANVKAVLTRLTQNQELGDEINAALIGRIDLLEDRVADREASETQQAVTQPEVTQKRLLQAAHALGGGDLMSAQMQRSLKKRADQLADGIEQVKAGKWAEQREKAAARLEDQARDAEKYVAAARELQKKNYIALFEMLNPRASNGDEEAQFLVGYMYSEALGVKRDDKEALQWLKRSASKNFGPAKALIGVMVYTGRGTKADAREAMQWPENAQSDGWSCELTLTQCTR
jgi:hypothetical protein